MTDTTDPTIESLFRLLDQWRHLPAYRLENRTDPFFALFLPEILKAYYDTEFTPLVIPEFPLKKAQNKQSTKVDYFALSKERDRAFLIELKTDMGSLDDKAQIEYLKCAAKKDLHQILCEIKAISGAERSPDKRKKYFHLLRILADLCLITLPPNLEEKLYGGKSTGVYKCIEQIEVTANPAKPQVVYILPYAEKGKEILPREFDCIGFKDVAQCVSRRDGEISREFAKYLEKWTKPAGEERPQTAVCSQPE